MSTSSSALVWALLAWLIASDSTLPWPKKAGQFSPRTRTRSNKDSPETRPRHQDVRSYLRAAVYFAIAALLISWPSLPKQLVRPSRPEPSSRVGPDSASPHSTEPHPHDQDTVQTSEELLHGMIHNETLGFEKIFVVNLPERTDKRDAMSLVAALTNIKLTWTSAIRGTSVPDKALPLGVDRATWRDGGIGSWRSQMNVIRTMVEENIASALILEDDADWDVRLNDQLETVSQGTRLLLDRAHKEEAFAGTLNAKQRTLDDITSPYGTGWDILWLGHCGETFPERIPGHHEIFDRASTRYTYYAIQDDETLPPEPADVKETWISGDLARHRATRWVHFSGGPTCSHAYALSQSGARKVLLTLSVGGTLVEQLDNAMSRLCRDHTPWDSPGGDAAASAAAEGAPPGYPGAKMRCLSVNPAVFAQHKPRGRRAAGSDIETVEDGEGVREVGESPNLVLSARLNVQNLMMGEALEEQRVGGKE